MAQSESPEPGNDVATLSATESPVTFAVAEARARSATETASDRDDIVAAMREERYVERRWSLG